MSMTGSQFYSYVLETFKRTDKSTEIYHAITDTIADILSRAEWEDYKEEAYTAGIATLGEYKFPLPDDFDHLISDIRILEGEIKSRPLQKFSKAQFDQLFPNSSESSATRSKPLYYCIFNNQVLLGPVPDKLTYNYEITYAENIASEIVSVTSAVPFSDIKLREMTKNGTLFRVYTALENDEQAAKYNILYEKELKKHLDREDKNTGSVRFVKYHGF